MNEAIVYLCYFQLSEQIQDKLDVYFNELKQVSDDTLRAGGMQQ